jgi:autotransporter-associated beta strand protein
MNGGTLGSIWPGPDGATFACPILVNSNSTINFNGGGYGNGILSGNITGSAGLIVTGDSQTRTFTGTNSYGWTIVSAGVLKIGNGGTSGTLGRGPITNGANLTFSRSDTLIVTNPIAGTGVLNQSGAGTLVLAAGNLYTGVTTVNSGTLLVNGSLSTNTVTVMTNATLGGSGSINGAVVITNNAILAPGTNNPGVLSVSGKLVLAANSTNRFRLNKGGVSDGVAGSSSVIYGGALLVTTNAGSLALAAGDSFRLFGAAAYSGGFSRMSLPVLGTNLVWDTSKLSVNGTLTVAAVVVITNQPQSVVADTGQNVSFTVGVTGSSPLSYQWYFNGANLPGATLATLALTNVQSANAGNYFVIVTNSFGSATSSVATLTVNIPPVVSTLPQMPGGGVQFSFTGPSGQAYAVLGSTNLALPLTNWTVLTSGTFGSGPVTFTDANPTNAGYFYRVASP